MTCEEVRISLGAYVLGALDAGEAAEVEAHLETCAPCRAELAELSGLPPLLARVSAEDIERAAAPPRAVLDGVFAGAAASPLRAAAEPPPRRGRRARVLLSLAASIVVAAVGGTVWVSAAQRASEGTSASVAAQDSHVERDQMAQTPPDRAGQQSAEALGQPFAASESPSAASSSGAVAKKVESQPSDALVGPAPEARGSGGDVRIAVRLVAHHGGTQVVARVAGVPAGTVCTLRAVAKDGRVSSIGKWTVGRAEWGGQKMVLEGSTTLRPGQIDRIEIADSGGRVMAAARV